MSIDEQILTLLQRTIDHEDPDRQYIGYLAEKIGELIAQETTKARIDQAKLDIFLMADALVMHRTPTRVVARLGSAMEITEKRIAELTKGARQ